LIGRTVSTVTTGFLKAFSRDLPRLAASADAADLAIDVRVFLFEVILGDCGRRGDIGSTRLTVA